MDDSQKNKLLLDLLLEQYYNPPPDDSAPFGKGHSVIVRTVTFHYTGRIMSFDSEWLVLDEAAWLPGWLENRWGTLLSKGEPKEVEPYLGSCAISVGSIVDVSLWNHPLPRDQR